MRDTAIALPINGDPLALDPFGFFGNVASRIAGLGGNAPSHDPAYAFHTPYVAVARGPARFDIRFQDLSARRGTLVLRIHMFPDGPGATAVLVNSSRIQLNRLVQNGGVASMEFQSYTGFTFALLGQIPDQSDARAESLAVTVDRPAGHEDAPPAGEDIRTTRFGSDAIRPTAQLVSSDRPTLAVPASQACTAEQMAEPTWAWRCREEGWPDDRDADRWPRVFAMEVLHRYGMADREARGGVLDEAGLLDGFFPGGTHEADQAVDAVACDYLVASALPGSLIGDPATWAATALACLRPGGLAILLVPLAGVHADDAAPAGPGLDRAQIERLALTLVSRRHEVAQLRFGGSPARRARGLMIFALVVRCARSPI